MLGTLELTWMGLEGLDPLWFDFRSLGRWDNFDNAVALPLYHVRWVARRHPDCGAAIGVRADVPVDRSAVQHLVQLRAQRLAELLLERLPPRASTAGARDEVLGAVAR